MAHGLLARAMCFANQRAMWMGCSAPSLCSGGCWISLSTVHFAVTGKLPKATELVGDKDLMGFSACGGWASSPGPQECAFGNVNTK